MSAYSKRPELLVDLDHMLRQLEQVDNDSGSQSVQSTGRVGRVHGLQDRLTDADVRKIILSFEGGTPRALSETRATVCVTSSDAGGGPSF